MKVDVITHYDLLVDEGNDPVCDPEPLKQYMDKWDGQAFIDALQLDKTKSVFEIGVGTGRLAKRVLPFCKHSTMVSILASQAEDTGSNPAIRTTLEACYVESQKRMPIRRSAK